jgi:hypothetical protein
MEVMIKFIEQMIILFYSKKNKKLKQKHSQIFNNISH